MNFTTLAGHVGKDPETRSTPGGQKVTTFSLATNVRRGGNDETIWWRITVWGDRFDKMMPYVKKGSALIVMGEISRAPEIWTDNSGQARVSSLELTAESIKFSPFKRQEEGNQSSGYQGNTQSQNQYAQPQQNEQQPPAHSFQEAQPAAAAPNPAPMGFGTSAGDANPTDGLPF